MNRDVLRMIQVDYMAAGTWCMGFLQFVALILVFALVFWGGTSIQRMTEDGLWFFFLVPVISQATAHVWLWRIAVRGRRRLEAGRSMEAQIVRMTEGGPIKAASLEFWDPRKQKPVQRHIKIIQSRRTAHLQTGDTVIVPAPRGVPIWPILSQALVDDASPPPAAAG